jgi:SAM-dependent methyltransferase
MHQRTALSEPVTACPLCGAEVRPIGTVDAQRTNRQLPIVECTSCKSLFNHSGYREEESILRSDAERLDGHFDASFSYYVDVIRRVQRLRATVRTHLDVGCGSGALLAAGEANGLTSTGVDLNPYAIEVARRRKLDARCERLAINTSGPRYDLVTCDQVLEHVEDPRAFLQMLASYVSERGVLFLNAPFRPGRLLTQVYLRKQDAFGSPFFDNDVHINHVSRTAMMTVVKELVGARIVVPFYGVRNSWPRRAIWAAARLSRTARGFLYAV